jgi:hypothetical protein
MPSPEVFSERKSSSMMTMGKRNFMDAPGAPHGPGGGEPQKNKAGFSQI